MHLIFPFKFIHRYIDTQQWSSKKNKWHCTKSIYKIYRWNRLYRDIANIQISSLTGSIYILTLPKSLKSHKKKDEKADRKRRWGYECTKDTQMTNIWMFNITSNEKMQIKTINSYIAKLVIFLSRYIMLFIYVCLYK